MLFLYTIFIFSVLAVLSRFHSTTLSFHPSIDLFCLCSFALVRLKIQWHYIIYLYNIQYICVVYVRSE